MADPNPPAASWEALQRPGRAPAASTEPPAHDTIEEKVARALTGGSGPELLVFLRDKYIERMPRPLASDAELREDAACRRLVKDLEQMIERAAEIAAMRARKTPS